MRTKKTKKTYRRSTNQSTINNIQGRTVNVNKLDDIVNNENNENRIHEAEKLINLSGATYSELNFDFHDLPYAGLLYTARRFHLGHYKHGRFNWTQGNKAFAEERLKHLMAHAAKFATFRNREDLEAILCNAMMLADFNERGLLTRFPRNEFLMEGKKIKEVNEKIYPGVGYNKEPWNY